MLGVIAQFENEIRKERQMEGIKRSVWNNEPNGSLRSYRFSWPGAETREFLKEIFNKLLDWIN
jgi:DNA invertase Pin-like site-specific DNA recombinase